jgi:hypothetical protein
MSGNPNPEQPLTPGERWTMIFFLLVIVGLFVAETFSNFQPAKLIGLLIVVFWMPLLILHEFGHAAMAWLLGWRVRRVVLGMGRLVSFFRVGQTPVELRLVLTTGYVIPTPRRIRLPQLESALIYFAGPGIGLLLVVVLVWVFGVEHLTMLTDNYGMIVVQSLCIAALAGAIINLFPHTAAQPNGETSASDGLGILRAFFLPTSFYQQLIDADDDQFGA